MCLVTFLYALFSAGNMTMLVINFVVKCHNSFTQLHTTNTQECLELYPPSQLHVFMVK
jgi:hypothetical protein